jgi:hypothetical protein
MTHMTGFPVIPVRARMRARVTPISRKRVICVMRQKKLNDFSATTTAAETT